MMPKRKPDYTKPGDDGGTAPPAEEITESVNNRQTTLDLESHCECGQRYLLEYRREEPKANRANRAKQFERLYREARDMAVARRATLKCPGKCTIEKKWLEAYAWGFNVDGLAFASITLGKACLSEAARGPAGIDEPADEDFVAGSAGQSVVVKEDHANPPTGDTTSPELFVATGPRRILLCPGESVHKFDASFEVSRGNGCKDLNFKPYVEEALRRSDFWKYQGWSCKNGCERDLEILRGEWGCTNVNAEFCIVHVTLYLRVMCKIS